MRPPTFGARHRLSLVLVFGHCLTLALYPKHPRLVVVEGKPLGERRALLPPLGVGRRGRGEQEERDRAARSLVRVASSFALHGGCSPHGHTLVCAPVLVTPSVRLAGLLDGRVDQLTAPRVPWTVDDLPDAFLVSKSVARLEKYR
jgi:hypothetical protein